MSQMNQAMLNTGKRVIEYFENSDRPFSYFILTFLFTFMIRSSLEFFAYGTPINYKLYIHYFLFYSSIVISFILFFTVATHSEVIKVARAVLGSFFIVLIGPIFDLIFSFGSTKNLTYFLPGYHDDLMKRFFVFFGSFYGAGIPWGIRIELTLILLLSLGYFYIKTNNIIKSLFGTFITYIILFAYCSALYIVNWFSHILNLKINYKDDYTLSYFYLISVSVQICILLYISEKNIFRVIFRNVRFTRLMHYELMFILGLVFGLTDSGTNYPGYLYFNINNIAPSLTAICISIFFACRYSAISNDIEDVDIDQVSNKDRPLVARQVSQRVYKRTSWILLFLALFFALTVDPFVFTLITVFIGNYFLYSNPPLRLKRITFFSKIVIGFNSLLLLMIGFRTATGTLENFPPGVILLCLIGFTAAANFIDIKDYEGDKKTGIKTLPVILGLAKAKFFIGLFFILNYLAVIFMLQELYSRLALCIFGILQFFLINRRNFDERPVFYVHLFSLVLLIIYFLTLA